MRGYKPPPDPPDVYRLYHLVALGISLFLLFLIITITVISLMSSHVKKGYERSSIYIEEFREHNNFDIYLSPRYNHPNKPILSKQENYRLYLRNTSINSVFCKVTFLRLNDQREYEEYEYEVFLRPGKKVGLVVTHLRRDVDYLCTPATAPQLPEDEHGEF